MGLLFFNEATLSFWEELASESSCSSSSLDKEIDNSSELEDDCSSANMLATFSEIVPSELAKKGFTRYPQN